MEKSTVTDLHGVSVEIGNLKGTVAAMQRQQEEAHRVIFDTLKSIERTVTIGSVQIPAMKQQIDSVEKSVADLEKEKNERKGAFWGISMTSGAIGGFIAAITELFSRHS